MFIALAAKFLLPAALPCCHLACIISFNMAKEIPQNPEEFRSLVDVVAGLRGPGGCPWDRAQTHQSLRESLLEECYEVLAALDEADSRSLCEELGDLLLQIVLHAQIAAETGEFTLGDVIRGINQKLVYRHPHVFGSLDVSDAGEVMQNWEKLKQKKRGNKGSMLAGVPPELPALNYAQEVQKRAAKVGFDWADSADIIAKLAEEVTEFKDAGSQEQRQDEFGDVLFSLANYARRLDIDLETALRGANRRFYRRFSRMEEICRSRGSSLEKLSLAEQNELWEEAKREERE